MQREKNNGTGTEKDIRKRRNREEGRTEKRRYNLNVEEAREGRGETDRKAGGGAGSSPA